MDLQQHMRAQLKLSLVQRHIFCPVSGDVMDVRTCVTVLDKDGDPNMVLSPAGWDAIRDESLPKLLAAGYTVDDPRVKA